jgi:plastocyanin
MRRRAAAVLLAGALAAAPGAAAEDHGIDVRFAEFGPSQLDVLPGESVTWSNVSGRTHTVTSETGAFDSGDLVDGASFAARLDAVGPYPYHCTIHAGMVGEVDVRRVILDALPPAAVPAGDRVTFSGRTADAAGPVRIERSEDGGAFRPAATATSTADGRWTASVPAVGTGDYRAATGSDVSETRRLLVSDRRVELRATRGGLHVTVMPRLPYARIVLEQRLRERFGWWPVRRARLDYVSEADLRVARPARLRVILVDRDGWTALATSRAVALGRP